MRGGKISGNTSYSGGGIFINNYATTTFRIVIGTVYGNNEADMMLRNTAVGSSGIGAALYKPNAGIAQYGTFSGDTWNSNGDLTTTDNTIKEVNGALQP
jgi:hypothetical protein